MRRLAAVSLGVALFLAPVAAWADEPDPEKVARIIEEIRAHRAAKERGTRGGAPRSGPPRREGNAWPAREHRAPRERPSREPTGGER